MSSRKVVIRSAIAGAAALVVGMAVAPSKPAVAAAPYTGSSFREVWSQVASDPYATLPHYQVTLGSFFGFFQDHLLDASRRTLDDHSDVLPPFRKLLHPNGVCLAGTWNITEETPYTGYFRKGSQALFIGRASTALTATEAGDYRAFGLAGKLFPTGDADAQVPTANFFTIENLGGTRRAHFLDALNTNDIIHIAVTPTAFLSTPVGAAAAKAFATADETLDVTQTLIRQLYPIAEAGLADPSQAVAPRWMMITGASDVPRVDADDFRDELRVANYPGGLRFEIRVADVGTRLGPKAWQTIGTIDIAEDAVSDSCDHRLHFSHPRFRR
jgi:hypothetical protein